MSSYVTTERYISSYDATLSGDDLNQGFCFRFVKRDKDCAIIFKSNHTGSYTVLIRDELDTITLATGTLLLEIDITTLKQKP